MTVGGILTSSGVLDIPSGIKIQMSQFGGSVGTPETPVVNHSHIFGGARFGNFRPVVGGSSLVNLGTIEASDGCIALRGSFTRADAGTLIWGPGGTFGIAGTLLNHNQTFIIDSAQPWELNNGTIRGSILQIEPGSELRTILTHGGTFYGGTLDNVIVNGRISHCGASTLNISNGVLGGNADIFLGPGPIEGPCRLVSTTPSLTISPTVVVHGGGVGCAPSDPIHRPAAAHRDLKLNFDHRIDCHDPRR